ncbi:hypothetical protein [Pantoea sp. At-9b]|uniref:hypothetical protein n=1 Tax=Pantoea sp. (strain At-9b) TaxID=592316 RepID=UPI0001B3E1F5|nr:hypothetical protein [Pantoea sp. At-9b]ADU71515.1 hypothetical protein Pat9b_5358 [Pantoea sp. At-9b]
MAIREPMLRVENDSDKMNLPEGKTCSDCVHYRRCTMMFGHTPADEVCDWAPSRFRLAEPVNQEGSHA